MKSHLASLKRKRKAEKPAVPNPCSVCGIKIFGSFIGTGDGTMKDGGSFAHPECYWRQKATAAESRITLALLHAEPGGGLSVARGKLKVIRAILGGT